MPYYKVKLKESMRLQVSKSSFNGHEWTEYHGILIQATQEAQCATPDADYAMVLATVKSNQKPTTMHEQHCLNWWQLQIAK